ncbi:hypothetical protein L914_08676 [Phytophthora nicotianae]|uniref:Uncharacterized protein n=1 Tax=Phytophthora nicotianae TaxID=4792 RepID=W2NFD6_PHYNI|nr:hypothetical protein L914_08676 [Phytophthora nicotianae]
MPLTAGKYEGYMRAATFLLDWLLRVHQHLHPAVNVLQLKTLNGAVQQISKNPASLSSDLLHELPNVLKPFHCAIGLREAFAAPLLANDTSKFAALLRIWYNLLQMVPIDNIQDTMAAEWEEEEDNYCPGEEQFISDLTSVRRHLTTILDWMSYFFFVSALEQLVRGVYQCYYFVKLQTSTVIEATQTVKLAMDTAKDLTTKLQQRHPEIQTTEDLIGVVKNAKTLNGSGNMYSGVRSSPYLATSFDRNIPSVLPCAGNAEAKSILALQGDGGLSRNTDVMFEHARNLSERMEEILTRPTVLSELQTPLSLDKRRDRAHIIERFNPVLA